MGKNWLRSGMAIIVVVVPLGNNRAGVHSHKCLEIDLS
jgi:hypothetical protein